jgi:CP family cyanate transporter-like MFS transporter
MPLGADRIGTRRGQLVVSSSLILSGLIGVLAAPDPGALWAVVLGAGMGAIFPIVLTLPVDVGGRPADVAATAALMLLVGYILSAIAPFAFGVARDMTGDYGLGLWLLAGLGVLLVGLCAVLTPARLRRIGAAEAV